MIMYLYRLTLENETNLQGPTIKMFNDNVTYRIKKRPTPTTYTSHPTAERAISGRTACINRRQQFLMCTCLIESTNHFKNIEVSSMELTAMRNEAAAYSITDGKGMQRGCEIGSFEEMHSLNISLGWKFIF